MKVPVGVPPGRPGITRLAVRLPTKYLNTTYLLGRPIWCLMSSSEIYQVWVSLYEKAADSPSEAKEARMVTGFMLDMVV